jgi:hypothetical protein
MPGHRPRHDKYGGDSVKTIAAKSALLAGLMIALCSIATADVIPTNEFAAFYSENTMFDGQPVLVGSIIDAYDVDGVHCGRFVVKDAGKFGFMPVYGDDDWSEGVDEGADAGQPIAFKINGRDAQVVAGDPTWFDGSEISVNLTASSSVIALTLVDPARDTLAAPGWLVRFKAGVRNDGDGLDFFDISAAVDQPGWTVIKDDTLFYADVNETVYVYFDVLVPVWPGDTVGEVTFTVFSSLDPSVEVKDTATLHVSRTDVGDDPPDGLPGSFTLHQNYPNPFNPTTTIGFALPGQSRVRFEVYNALGQQVENRSLGTLPAGEHQFDYDASSLASGVYLYRIVTEQYAESRKMVLLK